MHSYPKNSFYYKQLIDVTPILQHPDRPTIDIPYSTSSLVNNPIILSYFIEGASQTKPIANNRLAINFLKQHPNFYVNFKRVKSFKKQNYDEINEINYTNLSKINDIKSVLSYNKYVAYQSFCPFNCRQYLCPHCSIFENVYNNWQFYPINHPIFEDPFYNKYATIFLKKKKSKVAKRLMFDNIFSYINAHYVPITSKRPYSYTAAKHCYL